MNKRIRTFFLAAASLLCTAVAHPEGSCPPGMYPTNPGSTNGVNGCYPIPGYQAQQQARQHPAPQWERRWGAVAIDPPKAVMGVAVDLRSKREATLSAVSDCERQGGSNCVVEAAYDNQCVAVVTGDDGHNTQSAATVQQATAIGMKTCREAGDTNCRVHYSACSLPVRIH
ncbi:MAG: DUF4189 domain-containing protein [Variovorax sp.]|nr:MAG: DUF4189 domain-containing protein [Variovorax sp.]